MKQLERYLTRIKRNMIVVYAHNVSTFDLSRSLEGWQGSGPDKLTRDVIRARVKDESIKEVLSKQFLPVPYNKAK